MPNWLKQVFDNLDNSKSDSYLNSDPTRATMVIVAIMTVWGIIGVYLNLKSHL